MSEWTDAERFLLEQIRRGDSDAWSQLVTRFQGRLLAFARSRGVKGADAEDLVQDTFLLFLRGLPDYRAAAGLETYLFVILRRRVIEHFRGKQTTLCRLTESLDGRGAPGEPGTLSLPGSDPTASWYVRRDEQRESARSALSAALKSLVDRLKDDLNFRDLQIVEMLFYAHVRNKDIAGIVGVEEPAVALLKHRWLKQVRDRVSQSLGEKQAGDELGTEEASLDSLLSEVWEDQRPSCPKRSTIGGFLLHTLEPAWQDYINFHINRLGCAFCQANLEDLQKETVQDVQALRNRILQSTVGFLKK